MRRARAADEEISSQAGMPQQQEHSTLRRSRRGLRDRAGSLTPRVKLAAALILAWGLYLSLAAVARRGRGDKAATSTTAVDWREDGGNGGFKEEDSRRAGFRRLSMFGFELGGGDGGEWRTCRRYREDQLARHKTVSDGVSVWHAQ